MCGLVRIACLALVLLAPAVSAAPLSDQERRAAIDALSWIEAPGSYSLTASRSHLTLKDGELLLLGRDAARYDELINGVAAPQTEAVLFPTDDSLLYFEYFAVGHIEDGDWSDVDAEDFLAQIKAREEEVNRERARNGVDPFYTKGWREKPYFDAKSKTAYWALELHNDAGNTWVNAVALRLSRHGYVRLVWVGEEADFPNAIAAFGPTLDAHSFDVGARYADVQAGDKSAGFGVGALAATIMGVKLSKGIFAAILAFFGVAGKKILAVVVLGGGYAVWRRARRRQA